MSADTASSRLFFREAIQRALAEEMRRNPKIILFGQDIGPFGGSYREFDGLFEEFGSARVRDMPVAEAAMVGVGAGAAAAGLRSVVSITYMDFLMMGLDPLVNYAAKARFKSAGRITVPLVVKTTAGARGQGVAHSQCVESWMMGVPGLKVVAPSTPSDAYGLLKSALREPGPVLYVDHKRLFPVAGDVPGKEFFVPFGEALVCRGGKHVTLVSHSYMTRVAMKAAEALDRDGISAEVIDLRSLAPLDTALVIQSALRTGALVTVEEGQLTCGIGAELAYRVRECSSTVNVARVGPLPAPVSSNRVLEEECLPNMDRVANAVRGLLNTTQSDHR